MEAWKQEFKLLAWDHPSKKEISYSLLPQHPGSEKQNDRKLHKHLHCNVSTFDSKINVLNPMFVLMAAFYRFFFFAIVWMPQAWAADGQSVAKLIVLALTQLSSFCFDLSSGLCWVHKQNLVILTLTNICSIWLQNCFRHA